MMFVDVFFYALNNEVMADDNPFTHDQSVLNAVALRSTKSRINVDQKQLSRLTWQIARSRPKDSSSAGMISTVLERYFKKSTKLGLLSGAAVGAAGAAAVYGGKHLYDNKDKIKGRVSDQYNRFKGADKIAWIRAAPGNLYQGTKARLSKAYNKGRELFSTPLFKSYKGFITETSLKEATVGDQKLLDMAKAKAKDNTGSPKATDDVSMVLTSALLIRLNDLVTDAEKDPFLLTQPETQELLKNWQKAWYHVQNGKITKPQTDDGMAAAEGMIGILDELPGMRDFLRSDIQQTKP